MTTRIAINGLGRIGRCVLRRFFQQPSADLDIVAVNDLGDANTLAHLLEFDSVHGHFDADIRIDAGVLKVNDKSIQVFQERDPAKLPWGKTGVDVVMECTGLFRSRDTAGKHLDGGAKRVIVSAPGKDLDATFCVGINTDKFDGEKHRIVSNASCTTNCLAPLAKVLHDSFEIEAGYMVTVHAYTNDQRILDLPHSDLRRARAAAVSMIPTDTGAAKAVGLVLPELHGKLDGTSIRVPTPNVSMTCLTARVSKATSAKQVNDALRSAATGPLQGILAYEERPMVSCDFRGNSHSSIVDAALTQVVGEHLVEVQSWYDNEWGFSCRMLDLAQIISA